MEFSHLLPPSWKKVVQEWLQEDIPSFDRGGYVVGEEEMEAVLFGKTSGVLAGVPFFEEIFRQLDCKVRWELKEGDDFVAPKVIARVSGKARNILLGERSALDVLSLASGIASKSRRVVQIARQHGWHGRVAGTRKTTPGFRIVEKYALVVGGADTHRMDLSAMTMLKDNHIAAAASITNAVQKALQVGGFSVKVEVECSSVADAIEALDAGADVVMLDNHDPQQLKQGAAEVKSRHPRALVEASGGITEATIASYMSPNVDIISMGSLTQGVPPLDYSLKIPNPARVYPVPI